MTSNQAKQDEVLFLQDQIKIATSARTQYETSKRKADISKSIKLYEELTEITKSEVEDDFDTD